jgi:hypothetical protein
MLNKAFIDIMKKNLAADAAIMPQLQVLKNLQEHFVQEEADLVARTSAQSQQCESNLNSELVSDASASLIQHMHFLILESSLSPSPRIREQDVKLFKIIIHRGLTASHLWYCFFLSRSIRMSQSLCIYKILKKHARAHTHTYTHSIPYLVAQQCKEDSTAKDAMRLIAAFHQRETSLFVAISSMPSADVCICQRNTMGNILRLHEGQNMISMLVITHHHFLSTKTIHPEIRSSKVISEKQTLFSTIIVGRICDVRMCAGQIAREIRAKNMQVLDQIVTQLVWLKMIQLFPR